MANIYTMDSIRLNRKGLQTQDAAGQWIDLHSQQGRLDGACVVYSTIMALLSIGYLNEEDVDVWKKKNPDRRTSKGKLLSHLLDEQGLVRDGYFLKDMAKEIRTALKDYTVEHVSKPNCIYEVEENVIAGYPVILQVTNETFSHAILAIGTECDENDRLLKLLCLDPGYPKSQTAYWNCIIDTSRKNSGDYPFWYITDEVTCKVELSEFIAIYQ